MFKQLIRLKLVCNRQCIEIMCRTRTNNCLILLIILHQTIGESTEKIRGNPPKARAILPQTPFLSDDNDNNNQICSDITTNKGNCKRLNYKEGQLINSNYNLEIVLTFEPKKRKLHLIIYTAQYLNLSDDNIYCFTDASKYLSKKQSIRKVWQSNYYQLKQIAVYRVELEKYIGQYWCEIFYSNSIIRTNKVLAYKKERKGNEYALRLFLKNICKVYTCDLRKFIKKFIDHLEDDLEDTKPEIRLMEIVNFNLNQNDSLELLLHITTNRRFDIIIEYTLISLKLQRFKREIIGNFDLKSSDYCLPEQTILNDNFLINWPITTINTRILPTEICLDHRNSPIIRKCGGDFATGAKWNQIQNNCQRKFVLNQQTQLLMNYFNDNATIIIGVVAELVENIENFSIYDVYYLTKVLNRFEISRMDDLSHMLTIVDEFLQIDEEILQKSEDLLSLTDETLYKIDDLLRNCNYSRINRTILIRKNHLILNVFNPFLTNITGLIVYNNQSELILENLQTGTCNFNDVNPDNLKFIICIPETIFEQIRNDTNSTSTEVFVQILIYENDRLFIDEDYRTGSFIIDLDIPGYGSYLTSPIQILLHSNRTNIENCAYWDYGRDFAKKKGKWSHIGVNYNGKFNNHTNLHVCSFVHLTNFALLITNNKNLMNEFDDFVLEILTIIGCLLSIVGILGIFLTALLFKKWRQSLGTKILLNLSIVVLLEIICLFLNEINELRQSEFNCTIIGTVLHYVVLCKFLWMLIYAILQYLRFVKVFIIIPNNLLLKTIIIGWLSPLIFILILVLTTKQTYIAINDYSICYPHGLSLYLTVLLPICLITITNFIIFCLIIYEITNRKLTTMQQTSYKLQVYLGILLFFVLGIPWLIGIIALILPISNLKMFLFYIFCITSTLQGFVLFVFYVVLNRETRKFWLNYLVLIKY